MSCVEYKQKVIVSLKMESLWYSGKPLLLMMARNHTGVKKRKLCMIIH